MVMLQFQRNYECVCVLQHDKFRPVGYSPAPLGYEGGRERRVGVIIRDRNPDDHRLLDRSSSTIHTSGGFIDV